MSRKQVMNPIHAILNLSYYPLALLSLTAEVFPIHHQPGRKYSESLISSRFNCLIINIFDYIVHDYLYKWLQLPHVLRNILLARFIFTDWFAFNDLRWIDFCATGVFFMACYVSHQTFKQLAQLRRNRFGMKSFSITHVLVSIRPVSWLSCFQRIVNCHNLLFAKCYFRIIQVMWLTHHTRCRQDPCSSWYLVHTTCLRC